MFIPCAAQVLALECRLELPEAGCAVISIKRYLDLDASELDRYRPPSAEDLLTAVLGAYRAALGAMGNSGVQACPVMGPDLQRGLMLLADA